MKTVIELLIEKSQDLKFVDFKNAFEFTKLLYEAKKIEKQQIIQSWDNGFANGYDLGKHDEQPNPDDAEQYYNETFKSE